MRVRGRERQCRAKEPARSSTGAVSASARVSSLAAQPTQSPAEPSLMSLSVNAGPDDTIVTGAPTAACNGSSSHSQLCSSPASGATHAHGLQSAINAASRPDASGQSQQDTISIAPKSEICFSCTREGECMTFES